MSSVVSLGVPGLVALLVTNHKIPGSVDSITGVVASMIPGVTSMSPILFYVGSAISIFK